MIKIKMFSINLMIIINISMLIIVAYCQTENPNCVTAFQTPEMCKKLDTDTFHEYYDISKLKCTSCEANSTVQTTTEDRYECACKDSFRLTRDYGAGTVQCASCTVGQVSAANKWECVTCTASCDSCPNPLQTLAEKYLNGTRLGGQQNNATRTCVNCKNETHPDSEEPSCTRCNQILSVQTQPDIQGCTCPADNQAGGMCFSSSNDIVADTEICKTVQFENNIQVLSQYFVDHLRGSHAICRPPYANLTACQLVGNLCVMLLYTRDTAAGCTRDACTLHEQLVTEHKASYPNDINSRITNWAPNMPWLFYTSADNSQNTNENILASKTIKTVYNTDSYLAFKAARYELNGEYSGLFDINAADLLLCPQDEGSMNSAFKVGSHYHRKCQVSLDSLFDEEKYNQLYFYDLYLPYKNPNNPNEDRMYALPVKVQNYKDSSGTKVNEESDVTKWLLTRRFFLVDKVSGLGTVSGTTTQSCTETPCVVRYAQHIAVRVSLQKDETQGYITPPYVEVTYGEVDSNNRGLGQKVEVTFEVTYTMNMDSVNRDISIAIGVLCGLAVILAGFQTATWNRRMGRVVIDVVVLIKFLLYCCGTLGMAFFLVTWGFTIWWFIVYKLQYPMYLVPTNEGGEYILRAYMGAAFALICVDIIHVIGVQCTVDIFFVDWENTSSTITDAENERRRPKRSDKTKDKEVSLWRTCFVANQWNEIQTKRRINPTLQLCLVVLLLSVVGLENWARFDTSSSVDPTPPGVQRGEYNKMMRFGLMTLIYLAVAMFQWFAHLIIFRWFKAHPMLGFVDLCSLTNVSVFIMSQDLYGYYVHGRSPHGKADIGMPQIAENITREEEDLCSLRGLEPGSDQQTYEIALPPSFRKQYNKVLLPMTMMKSSTNRATPAARVDEDTEKFIQGYEIINKFVKHFIERNNPNISYIIDEKNIIERIIDSEFKDSTEIGYFYNDYGHSFDKMLFYGIEMSLQLFFVLLFGIVDLLATNYVIGAVVVYLIDEFLCRVRGELGQRNITKKTLIDERFLI